MSTGAATVAPEPLQRRRQPAQTQPQHEHQTQPEIMQLAARIMQATQELEEVRMLHLKTEEVLLLLLSEAQGNPSSYLDSS